MASVWGVLALKDTRLDFDFLMMLLGKQDTYDILIIVTL
jgi:hypothetical protein